jgi:hypothetical protein
VGVKKAWPGDKVGLEDLGVDVLAAMASYNPVIGAAAGTDVISTRVTGDTQNRLTVNADGKLEWGPGDGVADTTLWRAAAATLMTNAEFNWGGSSGRRLVANGNIITDGTVNAYGFIGRFLNLDQDATNNNTLKLAERTSDPAAPAVDECLLYLKDNAGKSTLYARFNTGAIQTVAAQP